MLQKLSQHIGDCYDRAADSKRRAERTTDFARKTELLDFERTWTHLARSYEICRKPRAFLVDRPHPSNPRVAR
jgi:hypothetical protein